MRLNLSLAQTEGFLYADNHVSRRHWSCSPFSGRVVYAVINKSITLGEFVAFMVYLKMLIWPMLAVGWVISLYQRGTASLERIDCDLKRET